MMKSGFLLILFLFPSFAKPFHISHSTNIASESGKHASHHDAGDCPVCQFHFSRFIEAEFLELKPIPLYHSFKPVFNDEKSYQTHFYSYFLRGPPSYP
jgi:hypothetical protein